MTEKRARLLWLFAASALYLVPGCVIAARRPLWHDEIFTRSLARLPTMRDVWAALSSGTDLLPPFFYVVERAALGAFGDTSLALRLPAILGSWVMGLCLFRFVGRRASVPYAALAMFFPLATLARHYVHEGRPTALVGAFVALALVAWQSATESRGRPLALFVLAASLAAAVGTHYYAVLVVIPFAVAEAVRSWVRRRIDVPVWLALACAAIPLVFFLPGIRGSLPYARTFWSKPTWGTALAFYQVALGPAAAVFIALLVVGGLATIARPRGNVAPPDVARITAAPIDAAPPHEIVVVAALAVMPSVAVVIANLTVPVFSERYVLWAMIGVAVLFAWAARVLFAGRTAPAVALALVLAVVFLRDDRLALKQADTERAEFAAVSAFLDDAAVPGEPIVMAQPADYLQLQERAPRALAERLVYLADPSVSLARIGEDTADRALLALSRWAPLRVQDYRGWLQTHRTFQIYARDGVGWWLLRELPADRLTLRARRGAYMLWEFHADAH